MFLWVSLVLVFVNWQNLYYKLSRFNTLQLLPLRDCFCLVVINVGCKEGNVLLYTVTLLIIFAKIVKIGYISLKLPNVFNSRVIYQLINYNSIQIAIQVYEDAARSIYWFLAGYVKDAREYHCIRWSMTRFFLMKLCWSSWVCVWLGQFLWEFSDATTCSYKIF